jgi:hypothetical protein
MPERVPRVVLDTVDVTVGTVARIDRAGRRAAGAARVAAPPARAFLRVGRGVVRRLPGPGDAVRLEGRDLRVRGLDVVRDVVRDVVLARLDAWVPVVVAAVLDRLDLTELVVRRVDLDRVVREVDLDAVLDRLDLTAVVVRRVDLDLVVREVDLDAVLDRLDLTDVVVRRVDLDRVARGLDVDAVVGRADLDAVIARVDLLALAEFVVDGIDLPKIIRESTGSVASEGLRQVRLTSVDADRALAQFVDRMLFRRTARGDGHVPPAGADADGSRA